MSTSRRISLLRVVKPRKQVQQWRPLLRPTVAVTATHSPFLQRRCTLGVHHKQEQFCFQKKHFSSGPGGPGLNADGLQDFILADIGEGITECEVLQWFVKPGDEIQEFDRVCEIQSDKATLEITSRYSGTVHELKYAVGTMAIVGTPLLNIVLPGGVAPVASATSDGSASSPSTSSPSSTSPATSSNEGGKVSASPAVRRLGKENGIDLSLITGTGPEGRVLKGDLLAYIQEGATSTPTLAPASVPSPTPTRTPTPTPTATSTPTSTPTPSPPRRSLGDVQDQVISITGIQRIMVRTMEEANAVPTLGLCDEINMDKLLEFRAASKAQAERAGVKISPLAIMIKATSMAISEFPIMNSHVNKGCTQITYKGSHNIGIAMDTPRGLLVPNIKNVQDLSIVDIAREINRLRDLGLAGKLGQEELKGGTFTLSNIGSIGGTYAKPLLVVPEVCIGALGKTRVLPRYNSAMELKPTSIMEVSWSADHRVIDGATCARFGNLWKEILEDPMSSFMLHNR